MHPRWQIYYLIFMLAACGGALCWQLFLPELAADYSLWGCAPGWQREIALWNVALIASICYALAKRNPALLRLMTLQATILCWALGLNHLVTFIGAPSSAALIHGLGSIEVLLIGGVWGALALLWNPAGHD